MPLPKQQRTQRMTLNRPMKRSIPSFNIVCWTSRTVSDQWTCAQEISKTASKKTFKSV